MPDDVVPLAHDMDATVRLLRAAVAVRPWIGDRAPELAERLAAAVRAGTTRGALYLSDGRPVGIATWEPHGPVGAGVGLWYLEAPHATVEQYRRFYAGIGSVAGAIAFVQGDLPGLSPDDEGRLLAELGLARFGRSEMCRRDEHPLGELRLPAGGSLRPVGPADAADLIRLHTAAYHGTFDRYLFIEHEDEAEDGAKLLADLFGGRWGPYETAGSWGLEVDGRLVGVVLSVARPEGVLIADVAVDPALQGQGIGRAVMVGTLRALDAAGRGPVYLNVTEGNAKAIRLYEGLGFVRTLGPSREWYNPRQVPAAP